MSDEDEKETETEVEAPRVPVIVLRQPVLERQQETIVVEGAITKQRLTRNGFVRTKEPLERREETLLRVSRSRVTVSWGGTSPLVASMQFSLRTSRGIGRPDWILDPAGLKALRAIAREKFPKPKVETAPDAAPAEGVVPETFLQAAAEAPSIMDVLEDPNGPASEHLFPGMVSNHPKEEPPA